MSFRSNLEYLEDLYCMKDALCFFRFLQGCHHRWYNEDFYDVPLFWKEATDRMYDVHEMYDTSQRLEKDVSAVMGLCGKVLVAGGL